jgi:hypothetical protein
VPGAERLIAYDDTVRLPIPDTMKADGLAGQIGDVPITPFDEGVQATVAHFRSSAA